MTGLFFAAAFLLLCCEVKSISRQKLVPLIPRPILYDDKLSNSLRIGISLDQSDSSLVVTLTFQPPGDCIEGEVSYNYSITLWSPAARYPDHLGPYPGPWCDRRMSIPVRGLSRDAMYTASLVAYNHRQSLKTENVNFYTTDVLRVVVEKGDHYMKIICWFVKGSDAKGCHVHIDFENSYTRATIDRKTFNVTQNPGRLVGSMCVDVEPAATADRVRVYDWKSGGAVGMTPLTPEFIKGTDSECPLMGNREDFELKRRYVVLSMTAVSMTVGTAIIFIGILCKIGKLHSHFLKPDPSATLTQEVTKATAGVHDTG